ncbi:amidase [Kineococcus rhizosphaerae]|uniref:amidase n=1 Tax=Kineococcus rhizosphaerae TaxID=559628 RepID=UPI0014762AC3|nr:amidase family protein [Kineococcus rhizosphaerae]
MLDATALAEGLRSGEFSAVEVRAAAVAAVTAVDPVLNAVVGERLELSPLDVDPDPRKHGDYRHVPFAVKDLVCQAAGVLHESGSALTAGHRAEQDSALMLRWRRAGLDVLYRTSTPEFGLSCTTESAIGGATHNPWDTTRTPGGSSGGSAALVAAGALPWAHANDAAGSIRIPAALCGLIGLKPSRGRVPTGPDSDDPLFGLSTEFAITRSVRDTAALLDIAGGKATGERYLLPTPTNGWLAELSSSASRPLRIAVSSTSPFGGPVDADCVRAVTETAHTLAALGHHVINVDLGIDGDEFIEMSSIFWSASIAETVRSVRPRPGRPANVGLRPVTRVFADAGEHLSWQQVAAARAWQNRITRQIAEQQAKTYDLLVTPSTARPAWPTSEPSMDEVPASPAEWLRRLFAYVPFTPLANVTGAPAITLPARPAGHLPVGVQFTAALGEESLLLSVAAHLEAVADWTRLRPESHLSHPETPRA